MTVSSVTPSQVRTALLLREEIALLDVRHEAAYATGHPLFAANMAAERIALEAGTRLPRKNVPIVVYDAGEDLVSLAADRLTALGYTNVRQLDGGLQAWRMAGFELFQDVNSYAKAFGELVESRRHTPSLSADEVTALIASKAKIAVLDVRRFDEYATMNIPGSVSVPGAELVLRAGHAAPDPETTIIVNCAGRTRSIIGAQSLINAGVANKVLALRNGTIGWTLAKQNLEHGADGAAGSACSRARKPMPAKSPIAPASGISAPKKRRRCRRRPTARSIASTFAPARNMRPVTSRVSATIREGSWSRRSTWRRRCAERASC
jgi:rhodanese-related sulfurtransferase